MSRSVLMSTLVNTAVLGVVPPMAPGDAAENVAVSVVPEMESPVPTVRNVYLLAESSKNRMRSPPASVTPCICCPDSARTSVSEAASDTFPVFVPDTDGVWPSCINLARKNYAVMDAKGKIKLTGNSIKSKKLPLYIEEFLDKGIKMLLQGDGKAFVEYYYEYLQKIFDKKVPLSKIAQRAKVKLTLDEYKKRLTTKTKAGNSMSRMAHMELAIQEGLSVNLGDVIMYVNNGTKASQGDVQKMTVKQKHHTGLVDYQDMLNY